MKREKNKGWSSWNPSIQGIYVLAEVWKAAARIYLVGEGGGRLGESNIAKAKGSFKQAGNGLQ